MVDHKSNSISSPPQNSRSWHQWYSTSAARLSLQAGALARHWCWGRSSMNAPLQKSSCELWSRPQVALRSSKLSPTNLMKYKASEKVFEEYAQEASPLYPGEDLHLKKVHAFVRSLYELDELKGFLHKPKLCVPLLRSFVCFKSQCGSISRNL